MIKKNDYIKKCTHIFVVNDGYIELRNKNGEYIMAVCCTGCFKELKKAVIQFGNRYKNGNIKKQD